MMRWIHFMIFFMINSLFAGDMMTTSDFDLIEQAIHRLGQNSLVLFDVDATLIVPDDAILKPKGKELFKQLVAGYTKRDLFREIRMKAPHSLVDHRSISLMDRLQLQQIPVIAFTAAPAKVRGHAPPGDWRVEELKRYGFDFSQSLPNCHILEMPKDADQPHDPLFKSGVLYSSFHSKGDILIAFLQGLAWRPDQVVFVDDELEHVQSVMTSLDEVGIPGIGIHYTAANEFPYDLNVEQAIFQINYFVNTTSGWVMRSLKK